MLGLINGEERVVESISDWMFFWGGRGGGFECGFWECGFGIEERGGEGA